MSLVQTSARGARSALRPLPLALALLLAAGRLAAAPAPAPAAGKTEGDEARALFLQGQSEYDLGHFPQALALFEQAYKKKNVPTLLYNIAQCHRQIGELKEARATYRAFLAKVPDSPYSALAREKLQEVDRALEAQATVRNAPPTGLATATGQPDPELKPPRLESKTEPKPDQKTEPKAEQKPAPVKVAEPKPLEAKPPEAKPVQAAPATAPATPPKTVATATGPAPLGERPAARPPAELKAAVSPLPPARPPEPAASGAPARLWTWVAAGGAVLALGGGAYFGSQSKSTADSISGSEHPGAQVSQLSSDVKSQAQTGNLLLGVGAGLLVLSGALFVLHF